jgi:hypothetical protein
MPEHDGTPDFDPADTAAIDDRFEAAGPDIPPEPPHLAFPPPQPAAPPSMMVDGAAPRLADQEPDMGAIADALRRAELDGPQSPAPTPEPAPLHQRLAAALPEVAPAPAPARAPAPTRRPPARPAAARLAQVKRPIPDFSGLPPAMAQSLAKLAGVPWPPQPDGNAKDSRELEDETAGAPAAKPRRDA